MVAETTQQPIEELSKTPTKGKNQAPLPSVVLED